MIKPTIVGVYCAAILTLSAWTPTRAQEKASHGNMSAEDAVMVSATAKVEALDLEKREITLKGPLGDVTTLTVDESVKRLNEIKPGDEVTAKYYVSVAAELREPTEKEKENPIMVVEGAARAPKDVSPAAGGLRVIRVVATVEGLERPTRKVTLKGPRGNYMTVRARDPKRLEKLHLGDTIVVTFTEALAMSVEKAK
jgi:Cu/Ag efflux protein CusF